MTDHDPFTMLLPVLTAAPVALIAALIWRNIVPRAGMEDVAPDELLVEAILRHEGEV